MHSDNKNSDDTLTSLLATLDKLRLRLDQAIEAGDDDETQRLIKSLQLIAAKIDQIAE